MLSLGYVTRSSIYLMVLIGSPTAHKRRLLLAGHRCIHSCKIKLDLVFAVDGGIVRFLILTFNYELLIGGFLW